LEDNEVLYTVITKNGLFVKNNLRDGSRHVMMSFSTVSTVAVLLV